MPSASLWFPVTVLALLSATAAAEAPDRAAYAYRVGFDASGGFAGVCDVAGFAWGAGEAESVRLLGAATELVVFRTWVNGTYVGSGTGTTVGAGTTNEQARSRYHIGPGPIDIAVRPEGSLFLSKWGLEREGTLTAPLQGARWSSGPPQGLLPAGPGVHHVDLPSQGVTALPSGIAGPARWVATDGPVFEVVGDGALKVDGAVIAAPGLRIELPPYAQVEDQVGPGVAHRSSLLFTYAVLVVEDLVLEADHLRGSLACTGLGWSGPGSVTFRAARGTIEQDGSSTELRRAEITLTGSMTVMEEAVRAAHPWGEELEVQGTAEGRFVAGADYVVVGRADPAVLPAAAASLLVVLLGLLAWKAKAIAALFTRDLKADPLEHPVRAVLHDLAHQAPGSNLADAVRISGASYSTVRHHARRLRRLGLIATHEVGRNVLLHPPETRGIDARRQAHLVDDEVRFLVDFAGDGVALGTLRQALQDRFAKPGYWATRVIQRAERAALVERIMGDAGVMVRRAS